MKTRSVLTLGVGAIAAVLFAATFVPAAFSDPPAAHIPASHSDARQIRVIDGDTFEDTAANVTYRIENIDTPETGSRARCAAERELGNRATRAARALITNAGDFEIQATGRIDRYERAIALVRVDGRDLGETLIAEGLARPWRGRREPWCDSGGNLIP